MVNAVKKMDDTWIETFQEWYEFGSEVVWGPGPAQIIRNAQQNIRQSIRRLDRERNRHKRQEQKLVEDLKTTAPSARCLDDLKPAALAISRCRRGQRRIDRIIFQMQGLEMQILETDVHANTAATMNSVSSALTHANALTGGAKSVYQSISTYEKQKAVLEMTQDAFSNLYDEGGEEEDADNMVAEIASEINIQLSFELPRVSKPETSSPPPAPNELESLLERFQKLKPS